MKMDTTVDSQERWKNVDHLLKKRGPFSLPEFRPDQLNIASLIREKSKVLVIGAGGLGCEILKNLALLGFLHLDVIDMDTIDISNLNRQFLFRLQDVGRFKAEVAAECIARCVPRCHVEPHCCRMQELPSDFYRAFHVIVCGLDSVEARRWINRMLLSLVDYDEEGCARPETIIPWVDGGTEGFKGNARVIHPGVSACVECSLGLYPPQVTFPLCTLAVMPRLPEHCIEYCRIVLWPKENPWSEDTSVDGDDPDHVAWIYEKSLDRAAQFNIPGVTYRLTQGVIKRIIPAVASTNAVIAGICATEVLKLASYCVPSLNNYVNFNDEDGVYMFPFAIEKLDDCSACSQRPKFLSVRPDAKLRDVIAILTSEQWGMRNPSLTCVNRDGNNFSLYFASIKSVEERTRPNLNKNLLELDLFDGQELRISDAMFPTTLIFYLKFESDVC